MNRRGRSWMEDRPRGVPHWFREGTKPCSCDKKEHQPQLINEGTGFSDSGFFQWECPACQHKWCTWIEG